MASASQIGDVPINKGDSLTVEVTEVTGDLVSVRFSMGTKAYHGILLQEHPSYNQYGINQERVRGTPFWPPVTTPPTGINLKTIPCSTERYSYKLEGQASCLSVFQPEAIKRSNRNQPAPQLSRILRPRRFVCRKCKKAYHIKENGLEMSSTSLASQSERVNGDSSAANSDTESAELTTTNVNGKLIRRNQSTISLLDNSSSQSIKQVTPSIIPKLNEDYALSGRESEADSNSDDPLVTKRRKLHKVEKPVIEPSDPVIDEAAVQSRRKSNNSIVQRPKKSKRIPPLVNSSDVVQPQLSESTPTTQYETVSDKTSASVTSSDSSDRVLPPKSIPKANIPPVKQSDSLVRKNRIKAQYVSVATPFRFPPSRSSKPDLLSISQLPGVSNNRGSIANRRPSSGAPKPTTENETKKPTPNDSARTAIPRVSSKKSLSHSDSASSRYRTRARPDNIHNVSINDQQQNTAATDLTNVNLTSQDDSIQSSQPEAPPVAASKEDAHSQENQCIPVISDSERIPLVSCVTESVSQPPVDSKEEVRIVNRTKATDYEKPKNRWIREARARRSQEERTSLSIAPSVGSNAPTATESWSNVCEVSSVDHSASSPVASSRLRSRSSEATSTTPNAPCLSPKSGNASKKRGQQLSVCPVDATRNNCNPEEHPVVDAQASVTSTLATSSQQLSPNPTQHHTESSGVCLPVLKIKINRQPQSSDNPNSSTQYEVIGLQVSSEIDAPSDANTHEEALNAAKIDNSSGVASSDTMGEEFDPKLASNTSGPWASSPTLSASSSKKCVNSTDLGQEVKKCRLSDGTAFRIGDLVWSKLSGWPSWPAQIKSIHRLSANEVDGKSTDDNEGRHLKSSSPGNPKRSSYVACLHWFAWHQVSYMPCDKLFHFLQHYKRFDNKKKRGIFRQAVKEAQQKSDEKKASSVNSGDSDATDEPELDAPVENNESITNKVPTSLETTSLVMEPESLDPKIESFSESVAEVSSELIENTQSVPDTPGIVAPTIPIPPVTIRRGGGNRGRVRSIRGRRGGSVKALDRVRNSPRSLPVFIPEISSQPVTFVRRSGPGRVRGAGRGRGRKLVTQRNLTPLSVQPPADRNTYVISEPSGSSGTLKIVLSTSKIKAARRGCRKRERGVQKAVRSKKHLEVVRTATNEPENKVATSASSCTIIPTAPEPMAPQSKELLEPSQPNSTPYDDPSAELLSQFPHVFPDLRASGILSDAVDIPTFSEDESEEEDAGRLIIDPDVMASVNSTSSLSVPRMEAEQHPQADPKMIPQEYYNTPTYFAELQRKESTRPDLSTTYQFMPVTLSRLSDTVFSTTSNSNAPTTMYNIPMTNSRPSSLEPPTSALTHVPPVLLSQTSSQLGLARSTMQQLPHHSFDAPPMDHRLSSYFRPSSQTGVPVTVSSNVVPYLTSNFPNL